MNKILEKTKGFFETYKENIFLFMFSIFLISCILTEKMYLTEEIVFILKIVRYLSLLPIILKILLLDIQTYKKHNWVILFILSVVIIINYFCTGGKRLIQYLIIILGSKDISFNKTLKIVLSVEGILVFGIIILSILGFIPNYTYGRSGKEVLRNSLGFAFSTYPAIFTFCLTCYYYYVRGKDIKIWEYIIVIAINIAIYIATNTRVDVVCSLLITIISFLYYKNLINKKLDKFCVIVAKYIMIILTFVSIIMTVIYNPSNNLMKKTNSLFSGRLRLMNNAFKENGFRPFGADIDWIEISEDKNGEKTNDNTNVVDNGYINIILNYGWIMLIVTILGYYFLVKQQENEKNYFFKYIVIITALHSFINPQIYQIVYNPFLLMFVNIILIENTEIIYNLKSKFKKKQLNS